MKGGSTSAVGAIFAEASCEAAVLAAKGPLWPQRSFWPGREFSWACPSAGFGKGRSYDSFSKSGKSLYRLPAVEKAQVGMQQLTWDVKGRDEQLGCV